MEGHETDSSDDFECNSLFKPLPLKPSFAQSLPLRRLRKMGRKIIYLARRTKKGKEIKEKRKKRREREKK